MDIFRFENSEFLWGLLFVPLIIFIYVLIRINRKKSLERFGDKSLLQQLMPEASSHKPFFKLVFVLLAMAFLTAGVANPQVGTKMEEIKREGVDVVIALDISNSMEAEDIKPNRLERAKQAINKLIDKLRNDRIGLVIFAGHSYLQLPLTSDYSAAKLLLSSVSTDLIPTQGTAIGSAIRLAMDSFVDRKEDEAEDGKDLRNKVIIVITDGENHEDDALGAAGEAAEKGIFIHTVGMGTTKGGPIPVYSRGVQKGYLKNKFGEAIVSKLDAAMLQQLAAAANGRFVRSAGADPELSELLEEIDKMEKKEFGTKLFTDYEDRFQYLLAPALLLMFIEFLVSDRKNRLLTILNIFGDRK